MQQRHSVHALRLRYTVLATWVQSQLLRVQLPNTGGVDRIIPADDRDSQTGPSHAAGLHQVLCAAAATLPSLHSQRSNRAFPV